jgi:hypothetical protein
LRRGDLKRASQEAWAAAATAASIGGEEVLQALQAVALELEEKTSGREREEAGRLRLYLLNSLDDARRGTRPGSAFERLLGRAKRPGGG